MWIGSRLPVLSRCARSRGWQKRYGTNTTRVFSPPGRSPICWSIFGELAGYVAFRTDGDKLFLSKLYIHKRFRLRGLAHRSVDLLMRLCREQGLTALYLTVNRENIGSIAAYISMGFRTVREQVTDIGEGYVMDDFVMEKAVER